MLLIVKNRNAYFNPTYNFSLYLYGKPGVGKSSFVYHFVPALNYVIEKYLDPEIIIRFVKQNLNKNINILNLEFNLRPNNNDMSITSIIQSRKLTLKQRYV